MGLVLDLCSRIVSYRNPTLALDIEVAMVAAAKTTATVIPTSGASASPAAASSESLPSVHQLQSQQALRLHLRPQQQLQTPLRMGFLHGLLLPCHIKGPQLPLLGLDGNPWQPRIDNCFILIAFISSSLSKFWFAKHYYHMKSIVMKYIQ
jgi:hypothetical protein